MLAKFIEGIYSAGETLSSAELCIEQLEQNKIGGILNYAMESADEQKIKLIEDEYFRILSCLKNHKLSCVALKPTSLIQQDQILQINKIISKYSYPQMNFEMLFEVTEIKQLAEPLIKLSEKAAEIGSRILIDAEQSNLQPGVDLIALYLMKRFNKNNSSTIYNTYQLYLKDSPLRLEVHKDWLRSKNASFAAKLVRGAYLNYEIYRQTSSHINYRLCSTKEQVDQNFNETAHKLICESQSDLIIATHNNESLLKLNSSITNAQFPEKIEYAYLMGFREKVASHVCNLKCLEYIPYGPSDVKIPYLLRRLEENISL